MCKVEKEKENNKKKPHTLNQGLKYKKLWKYRWLNFTKILDGNLDKSINDMKINKKS